MRTGTLTNRGLLIKVSLRRSRLHMNNLLNDREREVLALVGRGFTNNEIAAELFASPSSVKMCLHQACVKLGARNRAQAVMSGIKRGMLDISEFYSADELADLVVSLDPDVARRMLLILNSRLEETRAQTRTE